MNYARKSGRVFTVYSEPVSDWYNPPDDFLVQTVICESNADFARQFPGVPILDRPASTENTGVKPDSASVLNALASMDNVPKEIADKLRQRAMGSTTVAPVAPLQDNLGQRVGGVVEASLVQDKAILEYRLAAARNSPNLPVIRKFMLKLWPDLQVKLADIDKEQEDAL